MRIGFASIYTWRPHVEHLYFLARLAQSGGHEPFFLTCDADLSSCYNMELRGRPAWRECLQCRSGGIRSYVSRNVVSIAEGSQSAAASHAARKEWTYSSASTLGRFESDAEYASREFELITDRLWPAVQTTYVAAREWIRRNRLESICVFNGRMDVTRAIFEAARDAGVRVVTLERTWFGDGLQLYPDESCLGLRSVDRLVSEWRTRALTRVQAGKAAAHVAGRFLRNNTTEWRAYNLNATQVSWPIAGSARRILLVPGSRNEVWGHSDWHSGWPEPVAAYDALIDHLGLEPCDLILRCHPNWGEKIGKQGGESSERYYSTWAAQRGVLCIPSSDTTSTLSLIEQCDAMVVATGSAALEAGILGKQVIGTAPSSYQKAGIRDAATTAEEMRSIKLHVDLPPAEQATLARRIARETLRYCYTMVYRIPQYVRYVQAQTTTRYEYDFSANPDRLIELFQSGHLRADDEEYAEDATEEDEVLDLIERRDWQSVHGGGAPPAVGGYGALRRRLLFRPIDWVSQWKRVGDR